MLSDVRRTTMLFEKFPSAQFALLEFTADMFTLTSFVIAAGSCYFSLCLLLLLLLLLLSNCWSVK